jgi:hypothetical protein
MATQLAQPQGEGGVEAPPNEGGGAVADAVNFEAEARKMGWVPKDEFKGDPEKHIDAETFFNRSQELMPILKAANKQLREKMDRMDREFKKASAFFSQSEQRAYERARAEIRAEMEQAVQDGDIEAHRAAEKKLDGLEKPGTVAASDEGQRAEEFADWMADNRWYTNDAFRAYADAQADKIARDKKGFLDRSDLDQISKLVRDKFADKFPEEFGVEKQRAAPRSPVDGGGTAPARRSGKSFNDLPADAQRICDKWIANGIIKDRAQYVAAYKWD